MLMTLLSILAFVTILTLLVAAHELGHYLVAKWFKIGVEEFAIGMGRPYWVYKRKKYKVGVLDEEGNEVEQETEFTIRPLPLGGFVRPKGAIPEEDGSETKIPGGFYSKPPFQRFLVYLAGPVFSILAGWAILIPTLTIAGEYKPVNKPVIIVDPLKPAAQAGLRSGDKIVSINDKPITTFFEIVKMVRDLPPQEFKIVYERQGKQDTAMVTSIRTDEPTPIFDENLEMLPELKVQSRLGIGFDREHVPLSFGQAFDKSVKVPLTLVQGLVNMFTRPSTIKHQVGGPVAIFDMTQKSVESGFGGVFYFAGMLSVMLGILNLLPVVGVLDGGHMCISFIEMLRGGRRLSYKVQNAVAGIGMLAILMIFVSVITIDVTRKISNNKEDAARTAAAREQAAKDEANKKNTIEPKKQ